MRFLTCRCGYKCATMYVIVIPHPGQLTGTTKHVPPFRIPAETRDLLLSDPDVFDSKLNGPVAI